MPLWPWACCSIFNWTNSVKYPAVLLLLALHLLVLAVPPKPLEPDEAAYLYGGRNLLARSAHLNEPELMRQMAQAREQGFTLGPHPLGYAPLKGTSYTFTKPIGFPLLVAITDRLVSYRLLNTVCSLLLILYLTATLKQHMHTDFWPFILLLYLNPAVVLMLARPLMSDFVSMAALALLFLSAHCLITRLAAGKTYGMHGVVYSLAFLLAPFLRLSNLLIMPLLALYLLYRCLRTPIRLLRPFIILSLLLLILCGLLISLVNLHMYGHSVWTGYKQLDNPRRSGLPFAFLNILYPNRVNFSGIMVRNAVMFLRYLLPAYPVLLILCLSPPTARRPLYVLAYLVTAWVLLLFFQYKVPMNIHYIFIMRMFLPMAPFAALLAAPAACKRRWAVPFLLILSLISYFAFVYLTRAAACATVAPCLWSVS